MPNGYCSNVGNSIESYNTKFQNMKSHDYNLYFENLLPVAFAALLEDVLGPLIELSGFSETYVPASYKFRYLKR